MSKKTAIASTKADPAFSTVDEAKRHVAQRAIDSFSEIITLLKGMHPILMCKEVDSEAVAGLNCLALDKATEGYDAMVDAAPDRIAQERENLSADVTGGEPVSAEAFLANVITEMDTLALLIQDVLQDFVDTPRATGFEGSMEHVKINTLLDAIHSKCEEACHE